MGIEMEVSDRAVVESYMFQRSYVQRNIRNRIASDDHAEDIVFARL